MKLTEIATRTGDAIGKMQSSAPRAFVLLGSLMGAVARAQTCFSLPSIGLGVSLRANYCKPTPMPSPAFALQIRGLHEQRRRFGMMMCANEASDDIRIAADRALSIESITRLRGEYQRQGWVAIQEFVPPEMCAAMLAEVSLYKRDKGRQVKSAHFSCPYHTYRLLSVNGPL